MMAANMFIVLSTYYVLKTVREALILSEGGANVNDAFKSEVIASPGEENSR